MRILAIFAIFAILIVQITAINFVSEKYKELPEILTRDTLEKGLFYTEKDHFRPQDDDTLNFPYVMNNRHYVTGGPLFIYINDGLTFTTQWLQTGLMYDIARELEGSLITTDHRYFRENLPTKSASFEDLQFLSVEQSLADIAYLVTAVKAHFDTPNAKVVVWGTGLGATLAALAREKYPHLIDGAWSSSGIFGLAPRTGETQLHLSKSIQEVDELCADRVRYLFERIDYLIANERGEELQKSLNLCEPVQTQSDLNIAALVEGLINFMVDYFNVYHYHGIRNFCIDMDHNADDPLYDFSKWIDHIYGYRGCHNITYERKLELAGNSDWNQPGTNTGLRQWYYYKCSQIGLLETSHRSNESLFGFHIPESYHYYSCKDIFGQSYDYEALYDAIRSSEIIYGDKDNYETTNTIFTNGLLDKWFPHAMTSLIHNTESIVMNIPNHAKSADLFSISQQDSTELRGIKEEIRRWIVKWVRGSEEAVPYVY